MDIQKHWYAAHKYPITRLEIRVLNIPRGSASLNQEAVIHGRLPQRIVIDLTGNVNFDGAYHENRFRFHHFNMNSISLYRDGNQVGSKNLKPNFTRNEFVRSFFTLSKNTGIYFTNATIDISQNDFKGPFPLRAWKRAFFLSFIDLRLKRAVKIEASAKKKQ